MSLFFIKSILATIFLVVGMVAAFCMMTLMGKKDKKLNAAFLRRMHKIFGFIFVILLLVISYFCIKYLAAAGDQVSYRAAMHGILSLAIIILLFLKILIVRFYKQFFKYIPVMGMLVLSFTIASAFTSAGYYFLRLSHSNTGSGETQSVIQYAVRVDFGRGTALFEKKCSSCHYADKEETKHGPGLKDLLKKENLPHTRRPATIENVKKQLLKPVLTMPSFSSLSDQELTDLLEYLKTL